MQSPVSMNNLVIGERDSLFEGSDAVEAIASEPAVLKPQGFQVEAAAVAIERSAGSSPGVRAGRPKSREIGRAVEPPTAKDTSKERGKSPQKQSLVDAEPSKGKEEPAASVAAAAPVVVETAPAYTRALSPPSPSALTPGPIFILDSKTREPWSTQKKLDQMKTLFVTRKTFFLKAFIRSSQITNKLSL
jgi:hypothetical protein